MTAPPPPAGKTVVYVANHDSHDITVLDLDARTGDLAEIERHPAGGAVMPLAASRDGRFLHASIRSEPFHVQSLAIDASTGRLALIGKAPLPASMCWISLDRGGRFLLSASYGGSLVAVSPIGADGTAGAAQQVVATEANAHSIQVDPSNRFAIVACLGGGVVRLLRFDGDGGRLGDHMPAHWAARPGAGPRHFAFDASSSFVYLLNELDASVDVLAFDAAAGRLAALQTVSVLAEGGCAEPWAADIHLTPDGRFLYASERRTSTLAGFAVERASGRLTPIGTLATEAEPRGFAITPDGRFLLAAGQVSGRLSRYAIDGGSGALTKLGDQAVGGGPNWIEIVELPA